MTKHWPVLLMSLAIATGLGRKAAHAADDCVIYAKPVAAMGPQLQNMFSWFRDAAVRECITTQGQKNYYILTKPQVARFGVCQYADFPVSKDKNVQKILMMSRPEAQCPVQASPAYVITSDITPGAFLALTQFWDRIIARPATLDAADDGVKSMLAFQSLQAAVKGKQKMRLELVRLNTQPSGSAPNYTLNIRGMQGVWQLMVDIGPKGVEIIGSGITQ